MFQDSTTSLLDSFCDLRLAGCQPSVFIFMMVTLSDSPRYLAQSNSIPDASSAMMGDAVLAFRLDFFHRIIEEEINENSIELRLRMLTFNLPPQLLNAPDAASSQLDLPRVSPINDFLLPDVRLQRRTVLEAAEGVEYLGDPIICKHGDLIDVVEVAEALAFEAGPEIGD